MTLEDLLKPVKYVDEQVLRQYTKVGKKFKLDEGKRKYFVGMGLWLNHIVFCSVTGYEIVGPAELPLRLLVDGLDGGYNMSGIYGYIRNKTGSEIGSINPRINLLQKFNSILRLPTLAAGIGLVGKFYFDVFNFFMNGEPMDTSSIYQTMYGTGLISLASSMYIKEIDPKLLDKAPFWKTAYDWAKEKLGALKPQPVPQPVLVQYTTLDDCV